MSLVTITWSMVASACLTMAAMHLLVCKEIQTFIDYPPMQRGASFNLGAVKAELAKRMAQSEAAARDPGN